MKELPDRVSNRISGRTGSSKKPEEYRILIHLHLKICFAGTSRSQKGSETACATPSFISTPVSGSRSQDFSFPGRSSTPILSADMLTRKPSIFSPKAGRIFDGETPDVGEHAEGECRQGYRAPGQR